MLERWLRSLYSIESIIIPFIWAHKTNWISKLQLQKPREDIYVKVDESAVSQKWLVIEAKKSVDLTKSSSSPINFSNSDSAPK